ncbi:DUF3817 domain-containing protein [Rhodococcus hoagii]|nr:DUF3817 domain-containing protein [Prescottella equi]
MAFKVPARGGARDRRQDLRPIHGAIFVIYIIVTLFTARALRWHPATTLLALYLSIPPSARSSSSGREGDGSARELSADSTNAVGRAPAPAR